MANGGEASAKITEEKGHAGRIQFLVHSCSKNFAETNQVDLVDYANIVIEVAAILEGLGVVFKWAASDIVTKSQLVIKTGETSFAKILAMDTQNKQLFPNDTVKKESRTRALNRMTHVLQLTCGIIDGLATTDTPLVDIVSETYTKTICRIHKWVVQKMVRAGFYVIPYREDFL